MLFERSRNLVEIIQVKYLSSGRLYFDVEVAVETIEHEGGVSPWLSWWKVWVEWWRSSFFLIGMGQCIASLQSFGAKVGHLVTIER